MKRYTGKISAKRLNVLSTISIAIMLFPTSVHGWRGAVTELINHSPRFQNSFHQPSFITSPSMNLILTKKIVPTSFIDRIHFRHFHPCGRLGYKYNSICMKKDDMENKAPMMPKLSSSLVPLSTIEKQFICEKTKCNKSIYETLTSAIRLLEENESPEPTMSSCHLLSFALKNDFQWEDNGFSVLYSLLTTNNIENDLRNKILSDTELEVFSSMIQRRLTKEPIQYIIGQWDFHDITIKVRQPCLCPRPETEELVEYVAKDIQKCIDVNRRKKQEAGDAAMVKRKTRVLDVGCGTGAISIALAKMFSPNDVEFVAIDVAREAIDLTKENVCFILGDDQNEQQEEPYYQTFLCSAADFTNTQNSLSSTNNQDRYKFGFDVIVSNPPYIPKQDMKTLTEDVVGYEDYGALCGGEDGMDVIRDIVKRLPEWCHKEEVNEAVCWMEVDTSHPKIMSEWLGTANRNTNDEKNGVQFIEGLDDFYGLERFVKLSIKNV